MPMTPAQYAAWVRQQQNKLNQAVRQYNQEVDRVNRANKAAAERAVREYNREVDRVNQHNKRVVDDYNRSIRQHNQTVRQNNQNAQVAVAKYNQAVRNHNAAVARETQQQVTRLRAASSVRYPEVRRSTIDLNDSFDAVRDSPGSADYSGLVELGKREAENSATVAEALISEEPAAPAPMDDAGVLEYLAGFSDDLRDRWRGALFSLSPENPDASRHFCTSAREIFTEILERSAPNQDVVAADPSCELAPNSSAPSRRSKLQYLLRRKGADTPEMLGFVEKDVDDVLQLFRVFNEATHGEAGRHGFTKLASIRRRVEGGIMFLAAIAL